MIVAAGEAVVARPRVHVLRDVFRPNAVVSPAVLRGLFVGHAALAMTLWALGGATVLPTPLEVLRAFPGVWRLGLGAEMLSSVAVVIEALVLTAAIGLPVSYLVRLPAARPVAVLVTKFRFLGMVGLAFTFTMTFGGGHVLKVSLLTFWMLAFFVTSMVDEVELVPREQYNLARTLRMGEWGVVFEVVVLGTAAAAFDVLRANAAMGWSMLSTVENLVRSEGGIGVLLYDRGRYFQMADVYAIQIAILAVGIAQDYAIGVVKSALCPYAGLRSERR